MIGRLCISAFIGLMTLGATCEDTKSLDMKTIAHCIDPRKIDFKRGFQESCETVASIMGFGSKKATWSGNSGSGGTWFTSSNSTAPQMVTYSVTPAVQAARPASYAVSGARVVQIN